MDDGGRVTAYSGGESAGLAKVPDHRGGEDLVKHERIIPADDVVPAAFIRSLIICLGVGSAIWGVALLVVL